MNSSKSIRAKEIQEAIREVLYRDWDPLNVCDAGPKDEYDGSIGPLYHLLIRMPSRHTVAHELVKLADGYLGEAQASETEFLPIADKLLAIDVSVAP